MSDETTAYVKIEGAVGPFELSGVQEAIRDYQIACAELAKRKAELETIFSLAADPRQKHRVIFGEGVGPRHEIYVTNPAQRDLLVRFAREAAREEIAQLTKARAAARIALSEYGIFVPQEE